MIDTKSLWHSAKGTTWKDHKYIRIENGRYIYDEKAKDSLKKDLDTYKNDFEADRKKRAGSLLGLSPKSAGALRYEGASQILSAMNYADKANAATNKRDRKIYEQQMHVHSSLGESYIKSSIKKTKLSKNDVKKLVKKTQKGKSFVDKLFSK